MSDMGRMKETGYVWQVAERGGIIAITCLQCDRRGFVPACELSPSWQAKPILGLPARCLSCTATNIRAQPFFPRPG